MTALVAEMHRVGRVLDVSYREDGTIALTAHVPPQLQGKIKPFVVEGRGAPRGALIFRRHENAPGPWFRPGDGLVWLGLAGLLAMPGVLFWIVFLNLNPGDQPVEVTILLGLYFLALGSVVGISILLMIRRRWLLGIGILFTALFIGLGLLACNS